MKSVTVVLFLKVMKSFLLFTLLQIALALAVPIEYEGNATIPLKTTCNKTDTNMKKHLWNNFVSEEIPISRDLEDNIDNMAEGSNNNNEDGSISDAFHQYVKYYGGGSYAPYPIAPIAPYPPQINSPSINYGSVPVPVQVPAVYPTAVYPAAVYPAPYAGYLTTPASTTTSTTTTAATTTTTTTSTPLLNLLSALNPITFFTSTLPTLMMSTVFRVVAGILSAVGMFIFSGALGDLICNFSPLCNMAYNTISIFMNRDASRSHDVVTQMHMTPEKFVRSAIRKYRDLQKVYQPIEKPTIM